MSKQYAEKARLVIFKDNVGCVDFGIYIPEINCIMCLCCGRMFEMNEIKILRDFKSLAYIENTIASGFIDSIPTDSPFYQDILNMTF